MKHVRRDPNHPSGVAIIRVGQNAGSSSAVASGANDKLSPADGRKAHDALRRARVVLLQLETPLKTIAASVALAVAGGVRVVLNPAPARALPARLLKRADLLTHSEREAKLPTGMAVPSEAAATRSADKLLARGVQTVAITMGSRKAFVAGKGLRRLIPGFKVSAVDATGRVTFSTARSSSCWPRAGRCGRPRGMRARRRPFP